MTDKEFIKLSWSLLEAKIRYYTLPWTVTMSDSEYDILEKEYVSYCISNGKPNTIQSMVGVDQTRPSVKLAIDRIMNRDNGVL